jgi:L-lactate dehydrogenase complex protein LldF
MTTTPAQPGSTPDAPATGHDILFPPLPFDLKARATRSTGDVKLQQFIETATVAKDFARRQVLPAAFGEHVDAMRELAGSIKQHTLDHLDFYLEQFIDNATALGAQVHYAKDKDQANAIAVSIARENHCKLCVKSKTMVTEEVQLLPELEAMGCQTIETDLGEFILQIDHDAPSHIVTPMIHKDRTAVARAFERELGAPYTEDAAELTQIARQYLREKYRQADLGISGANFLVAETGSIVICTNEGNGRFCTSAPKTHIVFVGIEKLIPRMEHLSVMLKMLARSSTGQPLTCYTHIITGPKRDQEHDGPRQMHIILVDNGRTEVLKEETREMLRCIRCGACLNACPVYRKIGGHAYGAVYSGPIGAILTPMLRGLANYADLPNASSLCGACYEACPVKINIPKHLIRLREQMIGCKITRPMDRLVMRMWARSLRYSMTYRLGGWMQTKLLRSRAAIAGTLSKTADPYTNRGWVSHLPGAMGGWTSERDMPTPPSKSFRDWWRQQGRSS